MPKHFTKTKNCGCVVKATSVGVKKEYNTVLYLIGGHKHINMCETCKQDELNEIDTLYNMWKNGNITDGTGNDGWIESSYYGDKSVLEK